MIGTFIISSLLIVAIILLSCALGGVIRNLVGFRRDDSAVEYFFRIILGLVSLVVIYAAVKSTFQTTMLMFLVAGAFLLWKSERRIERLTIRDILPHVRALAGTVLLSMLIVTFLLNYFETITLQQDSVNYLKISESLRITGNENTRHFRNVYSELFNGIEPYHYFEMWLGAFVMDISFGSIPNLIAFRVVGYGVILTGTVVGLYAVFGAAGFALPNWIKISWAILFLFFVPDLFQLLIVDDKLFGYDVISNPIVRLNFRTYWLFLLPPLILFLQKSNVQAMIALLALTVVSFTNCPAVFSASFLLIISNRWLKLFSQKEAWRLIAMLGIFGVVYLVLLYTFRMQEVGSLYSYSGEYVSNYFKSVWRAIVGGIFLQLANVALVYGPYLVLIIIAVKKWSSLKKYIRESKSLFALMVAMNVAGIIFFQLVSFMNNSYQFAFVAYCLATILVPILVLRALNYVESVVRRYFILGILSVLVLFSAIGLSEMRPFCLFDGYAVYDEKNPVKYDADYIAALDQLNNQSGAYIADSTYYSGKYYSKRLPDFYFLGSFYYLAAHDDDCYQFCLSDTTDIVYGYDGSERDRIFLRHAVSSSLFHMEYYSEGDMGTIGGKRAEAIEKYNISYIILTPGANPDAEWSGLVKKTITDKTTGEKLLLLSK